MPRATPRRGNPVAPGNTPPIPRDEVSVAPGNTPPATSQGRPVAPGNTPSHGGTIGHDHAPQSEGWRREASTCHHLAGTLAQLGRRVLLVDNDPQSSLTQGLWGPSVAVGVDPAETIAAVYAGEAVADRIIKPSGIPGVDLVPGSVRSTRHNVPVPYEADWDAQTCLRRSSKRSADGTI